MIAHKRPSLSSHISALLSAGRIVFTSDDIARELGVGHGAFLDAAGRLRQRKVLVNPRQGFYVAVPPQHASWGAPPPSWYIDALMRHEEAPYYVGLLKAAELHGAAHQAVMEFQVVTAKRLPKITVGRSRIAFYYRKDMVPVSPGIEERKTDTGSMKISSPALTALDLLRYPHAAGGLDNIATVLSELADMVDAAQLAELSDAFERPVVQRVGHMLERLGHAGKAEQMKIALEARGNIFWTELDRAEARDPDFAREPVERDARWRVIVRRMPEVDE